MTIFYSASTLGFYDDSIHTADQIPVDAKEISAELHAALLDGQSKGKQIVGDGKGLPILVDPPAPEPVVPDSISAAQGMIYLHRKGLLDGVKAWVYDPETDLEVVIAFEREVRWNRNSPFVAAAKQKFQWTTEQVDLMFIEASEV